MAINKENETVTCDKCGTVYQNSEIEGKSIDGFLKFYRLDGQDICELCVEDNEQ